MNKSSRALESDIVAYIKNHFEHLGFLTATEFSLGYGRADLVVFTINPTKCVARFNNKQFRPLDRVEHYAILRLLPEAVTGGSTSLDYLSKRLEFSPSYLRRELISILIHFGYVIETSPRQYAKVNGFVPIADEIWAIEVKVKDWRKGAIQAKRYQVFANRVFLAVSEDFSHRVDKNILREHNIGLLRVGEDVIEELTAPKLKPRDTDRFNFATEWIWRYKKDDLGALFPCK